MPNKLKAFFGVLILLSLMMIITQSKLLKFNIKQIECQLDDQDCPVELTQQLTPLHDKSFLFSPLERDIRDLNINLYQLDSIQKSWPNTVRLNFSHKPNSYQLKFKDSSQSILVTANGLTHIYSGQKLPLIEVSQQSAQALKNEIVNEELHQLNLNLVQFLASHQLSYQSIKINSFQEIEILLSDNLIALTQKDGLKTQISKLAIIIDKVDLKAIDLQINRIDLRFKFPVLKIAN